MIEVDDLLQDVDGAPVRAALGELLRSAELDPLALVRSRIDPAYDAIREDLDGLVERLDQRAARTWEEARESTAQALQRCEPWLALAGEEINRRHREAAGRLDEAVDRSSRGDPFTRLAAAEAVRDLPVEAEALVTDARDDVQSSVRGALGELHDLVDRAPPELKATPDWVAAGHAVRDHRVKLEGVEELPDAEAVEILDDARHQIGVHVENLEVTGQEMTRQRMLREELREEKLAEDRAVLAVVRKNMNAIHLELAACIVLTGLLIWGGPLVLLAAPAGIMALLQARKARAILAERVWSIPKGEVTPLDEALLTRLIIAALELVLIVVIMVISWMMTDVGW